MKLGNCDWTPQVDCRSQEALATIYTSKPSRGLMWTAPFIAHEHKRIQCGDRSATMELWTCICPSCTAVRERMAKV